MKRFAIFLFSIFFALNVFSAKAESVDNGKPLFVIISTDWCYACKMLHPVINELEAQYSGQVNFLHLDASSDESINSSRQVAYQYGLAAYFDSNRNIFPKVGILCPGSTVPEKIIIGASSKETYIDVINTFILDPNKICNVNGRPAIGANVPDRPDESVPTPIAGGRPDTPSLLDRPNEILSSGRPKELSFWTAGQPIPFYAYYQYIVIPKCSSNNNIICSNTATVNVSDVQNDSPTVFSAGDGPASGWKPYDPNATRNEKGWHLKK